jgi:hypothetical protein
MIPRRTFLRGAGTAIALPFLEAMLPGDLVMGRAFAAGARSGPPLRLAFFYVPNGVHIPSWAPSGVGKLPAKLPPLLRALEPFRDDLLVFSGLTQDGARAHGDGPGDHARAAAAFLTGAHPYKTGGKDIRAGVSVDQYAAERIGKETPFASLELGCEDGPQSGSCDSGYSCAYSNNISWASPTTPMALEVDPRRVFDRLFAGDSRPEVAEARRRRLERRRSILDFVREDSRKLQGRLDGADRRKLDEYLTGVREIERRLEKAAPIDDGADVGEPAGLPRAPGERLAFPDHVKLLADMIVLAFQGDVTRIATFMFAREGSNRNYREVDVADGHHDLSHHQGRPEKLEKIGRIDRFHVSLYAYLVERLDSILEGDGTLLDNCMVVFGGGINDGNRHNNENLPVVLAGSGGGSIDTGRFVRYPYETPMCNLFLSMLDRMGVHEEFFGDGTGRLRGLTI